LLSPLTARISQGLSDKTTIASLERNNNYIEQSALLNQDPALKHHIVAPDLKPNNEHIPSFLKHFGADASGANNCLNHKPSLKRDLAKCVKQENSGFNSGSFISNSFVKYNYNNSKIATLFEKKSIASNDKPIQVNDNSSRVILRFNSEDNRKKIIDKQNLSGSEAVVNENNNCIKNSLNEVYLKTEKYEKKFLGGSKDISNNNTNQSAGKKMINMEFFNSMKSIRFNEKEKNKDNNKIEPPNSAAENNYENENDDYDLMSNMNNSIPICLNLINKNKTKRQSLASFNQTVEAADAENFENEEIKKFNSWNNPRNTAKMCLNSISAAQNKNVFEDLNIEKDIAEAVYNSINIDTCFESCDKSDYFMQPRKSNKDLIKCQFESKSRIKSPPNLNVNWKRLEKSQQQEAPREFLNLLSNNYLKESKDDLLNVSNTNNLDKNNNDFSSNNPDEKFKSERFYDYFTFENREFSKCNTPSVFGKDAYYNNNNNNKSKSGEEEKSDDENLFSLESQFITNNKKIFLKDEISYVENFNTLNNENEKQNKQIKNLPKTKFTCSDNQNKPIPNNNRSNNYLNFAFSEKETNKFDFMNNNQFEHSFNSAMSFEFPLNTYTTNNSNIYNLNPVNTANPHSQTGNLLYDNYNIKNEIESGSEKINYDLLRKFNTSDAVRPPKVFLELNKLNNSGSHDPMLIVTAEIESKNNLFGNIYSSYNGSNYKSNRSTSNDSKEPNNHVNNVNTNINLETYNSKESINNNFNNNNIILKTFNSGNSINTNTYNTNFNNFGKVNTQQKTNKIYKEKDLINNIKQVNNHCKSDSANAVTTTNNDNNNHNNNTNITSTKKPMQKKQIFFPTEINIKNLSSIRKK